ncbi:MAG: energy transducer TonB [Crocinitomicaceae bacterium]
MNAKVYVALVGYVLIFGQCQHDQKIERLSISQNKLAELNREGNQLYIQSDVKKKMTEFPELLFENPKPNPKLISKSEEQEDKRKQVFKINTDKDTMLTCLEGTTIKIPKEAFENEKGESISGEVEFVATEYYQLKDIMEADLTTKCGDRVLETGGTVNLRAFANKEKLKLKKGKELELGFPHQKKKEGMEIFQGIKKNGVIEWETPKIGDIISVPERPNGVCDYVPEIEEHIEDLFIFVEIMPQFPGGEIALMKYISDSIKIPSCMMGWSISGTSYIQFVVEKDGSISNVEAIRGLDPCVDSCAVEVIAKMPKWKPGEKRGKKVRTQFTIPIKFCLFGAVNSCRTTNNPEIKIKVEEKIEEDKTVAKKMSNEAVGAYLLSTSNLGWINCDRFLKESNLVSRSLAMGSGSDMKTFVIFKNYKSILRGNIVGTTAHLRNIPRNEEIIILALKKVNGENQLSIYEGTANSAIELKFKAVDAEYLKSKMNELSQKWKVLS